MATQATAASRKKDAGKDGNLAAFASITAADIVRAPATQRSIPIDLLPLLKPFKRSGRLALRIERLPQRAKFSAGRRNSDGSWSLASDELEELNYLIPSNIEAAHELTIRVMKFDDGAASTLKLIQYPIAALDAAPPEPAGDRDAICRSTEANDPILRSQLGEMHSLFAVRESELAALRVALESMKEEKAAELEKARAAWELELKKRLAEMAVRAQSDKKRDNDAREGDHHAIAQAEARAEQRFLARLEQAGKQAEQRLASERKAWQAESNAYFAAERQKLQAETEQRIAAEHEAWLLQADKRVVAERDRLLAETEQRIAAEREKWLAQAGERSAAELENWKTQTEARIEAEHRDLRAQVGQSAVAELERLKSDAEQHIAAERRKWQAEAEQQAIAERARWQAEGEQRLVVERQRWQADAEQHAAAERARWQSESEQRFTTERQKWQAEADQRLAAELARRQSENEQYLSVERQKWQVEADQRTAAEFQHLQTETQRSIEAGRKSWQAETEHRLAAECRRLEAENLVALSKAEERWKADEAERSAAARNEWQNVSARLLAEEADKNRKVQAALTGETDKSKKLETALEALIQAKSVTVGDETQELDRLRTEQALLRATLAEREAELGRHQADLAQERDRWRQESENQLRAAAAAWKAEESARLDGSAKQNKEAHSALAAMTQRCEVAERALAKGRAEAEDALAEMTQRCDRAEQALAEARRRAPAASAAGDDGYVEGLRAEVAELRKALANQEVELGWARAALDETRPLHLRRAGENLPIGNFEGLAPEPEEPETNAGSKRTLVRDCLLVIGLVVPLVLFYPWLAAYLPDNVRTTISSATGGLLSTGTAPPAVTPPAAAPVKPPVERPSATVAKSVNVRATPAVTGTVVVTLQKSATVVVLEQQGNWTHVEVPAKTAKDKPLQGWVYSTYLDAKKADQ